MKKKVIRIIDTHTILLYYDCTYKEFAVKYDLWEEDEGTEWRTYLPQWLTPIIWMKDIKDTANLAHEFLHAIFHISRTTWIEYNEWSEEWFTYSLSHALREIQKLK